MVLKIIFSCVLISILASCNSNESVEETVSENKADSKPNAKELFMQHCAVCHGDDGELGAAGAKDLSVSKLSDKEIKDRIIHGKNGMPPMKDLLKSEENISAVVEYVKKMKN